MNLYKLHSNPEELEGYDTLGKIMTHDGSIVYRNERGAVHRDDDLPAVIHANGSKAWYKDGQLHREGDLPAVISHDGGQRWFKYDRRHRDNHQPAIIHADGTKQWYVNGVEYNIHHHKYY
jgi:hypothetical protein